MDPSLTHGVRPGVRVKPGQQRHTRHERREATSWAPIVRAACPSTRTNYSESLTVINPGVSLVYHTYRVLLCSKIGLEAIDVLVTVLYYSQLLQTRPATTLL